MAVFTSTKQVVDGITYVPDELSKLIGLIKGLSVCLLSISKPTPFPMGFYFPHSFPSSFRACFISVAKQSSNR